jgi:hypothetical protein
VIGRLQEVFTCLNLQENILYKIIVLLKLKMKKILITPPFASPLYVLPLGIWLLNWSILVEPYFEAIRKLKTYRDGDAMAILLAQVSAVSILPPFIALVLFLILRNYPGCTPLVVWNRQKQCLSILWTGLFLTMILFSLIETQRMLSLGLPFNALVCLVWVYLYLAFRSILIEKTKNREVFVSSNDPDYQICPRCKLEQWKGYDKCQRCSKNLP